MYLYALNMRNLPIYY